MAKKYFGPSYYAVITGPILDDRELAANAKLLYASITSLTDQKGYCWASNEALAERFGWGERTVTRLVAQLQQRGFIRTVMALNEETRKMERRIFIGNEAAEGVAKIGEVASFGEGGVAKTGDTPPNIKKNNKRENKYRAPEEIWQRCVQFCGGSCDLEAALYGFLENRWKRGNALETGRALSILLGKLERLSGKDHAVMAAMLDKSVERNWDSVYELKPDELAALRQAQAGKEGGYGWQ